MAKIKQVSFVMNDTDYLVTEIKKVAEEYQIPLNTALKVLFTNMDKENKSMRERLNMFSSKTKDIIPSIPLEKEKEVVINKNKVVVSSPPPLIKQTQQPKTEALQSFASSMGIS